MRVSIPVVCGFIAMLSCSGALAAAKIYKWTDEKGITHYSEHPPLNTKTTRVKPQIDLDDEYAESGSESSANASAQAGGQASSVSSSRQSTAEERAAARAAAKRDPDRCEAAKDNVNTLKTYTHIKVKEGEEYRYLTPDEQAQKLAESTKAMNESCEPGALPPADGQQ